MYLSSSITYLCINYLDVALNLTSGIRNVLSNICQYEGGVFKKKNCAEPY